MRRIVPVLYLLLLVPALALAEARLISAVGEVSVLRQGVDTKPAVGEPITGAFVLRTGSSGETQIRLADGTLLTLLPDSEIALDADPGAAIELTAGGVDVMPAKGYRTVRHGRYSLRTNGLLKLRTCARGCNEPPGLYGRPLAGETIVEYAGGRVVVRNRPFHAGTDGRRPVTLAREPALFGDPQRLQRAELAKARLADELRMGMTAFKDGDYDKAREHLERVSQQSPSEHIVSYTLGLIALDAKDNAGALRHFQQYSQAAPEAARERGVNQMITLLLSNQLEQEVRQAMLLERSLSSEPPEPNTIAVQPFTNRSDPAYGVLAKGIAAMVITDLSKVPGLKVLERQMVQRLLDEIRLSESGAVDQDSLVRAGRLMRAEKVIVGGFGVE
jgi:hypothetical protein